MLTLALETDSKDPALQLLPPSLSVHPLKGFLRPGSSLCLLCIRDFVITTFPHKEPQLLGLSSTLYSACLAKPTRRNQPPRPCPCLLLTNRRNHTTAYARPQSRTANFARGAETARELGSVCLGSALTHGFPLPPADSPQSFLQGREESSDGNILVSVLRL